MRATKGIMIGYAGQTNGYRIYNPEKGVVEVTLNVSFNENEMHNGRALSTIDCNSEYGKVLPKSRSQYTDFNIYIDTEESDSEPDQTKQSDSVKLQSTLEKVLTHSETEESGDESPMQDDLETKKTPCDAIKWVRKTVMRK